MGRAECQAPPDAGPSEVCRADELRGGEYLAFTYGPAGGPPGFGMAPVRGGDHGREGLARGWVWGRVAEVGEQLWHGSPLMGTRKVWVLCEFGDQSSIITTVPHGDMIVVRRLPT
ncbi:hypothetical protein GCM10022252_45590 [Streptosporangium oxazolinicum]|uniref:Uncharacterized protein n=1 Tax=Streptosporangium oxazolinicum TaxID=909287 RepID=A0ABP8B3I3_9ACTN